MLQIGAGVIIGGLLRMRFGGLIFGGWTYYLSECYGISFPSDIFPGYSTNSHHDQLPGGLRTQLVKYCPAIAGSWVGMPFKPDVLFVCLFVCLFSHLTAMIFHVLNLRKIVAETFFLYIDLS